MTPWQREQAQDQILAEWIEKHCPRRRHFYAQHNGKRGGLAKAARHVRTQA